MAAEPGSGPKRVRGPEDHRRRKAVATSILGVLLVGLYFATDTGVTGSATGYLIHAVVLAAAFWFPSQRIRAVADLVAEWRALVLWLLAWVLVWDLATSGVLGDRELFARWWVVYPAGVLVLGGLLALHGAIMGRTGGASRTR